MYEHVPSVPTLSKASVHPLYSFFQGFPSYSPRILTCSQTNVCNDVFSGKGNLYSGVRLLVQYKVRNTLLGKCYILFFCSLPICLNVTRSVTKQ